MNCENLTETVEVSKENGVEVIGIGYGKESEDYLNSMYKYYNDLIFNGKLPVDTQVKWNNRTTRVIGTCYPSDRVIELSKKYHSVNDNRELSNTLIHEMIHLIVENHSEEFYLWATRVHLLTGLTIQRVGGEEDAVGYYRYEYKCLDCGRIGRKNVKVDGRYCCGECRGTLVITKDMESDK